MSDAVLGLLRSQAGFHPRLRVVCSRLHNLMAGNRCILRGRQNRVNLTGPFLRGVHVEIVGDRNVIDVAFGVSISSTRIIVRGDGNRIAIGQDCLIKSSVLWCEGEGGVIELGHDTTIEEAHIASNEGAPVRIGTDCMFAFGVDVRSSDSHSILDAETGDRLNSAAPISVGDHVWVGANVQILKGVSVGENSILGARSVATHDVSAGTLVAGCPARELRTGVTWTRQCL